MDGWNWFGEAGKVQGGGCDLLGEICWLDFGAKFWMVEDFLEGCYLYTIHVMLFCVW